MARNVPFDSNQNKALDEFIQEERQEEGLVLQK